MNADGEAMATRRRTSEEIDREAEENRKEALLASTLSLQPNFNRSNVSQKQISKLQVRFFASTFKVYDFQIPQ